MISKWEAEQDRLVYAQARHQIPEFKPFPKIPRLHRDVVITEKIDGTNAGVIIVEGAGGPEDLWVYAQSRSRIITPGKDTDNYGFAAWVAEYKRELAQLGVGHHFGEWYGRGIQRGYGLDERRFALFNPDTKNVPACCEVVPVILRTQGQHLNASVDWALERLRHDGSLAARGFDRPEGIIVYHVAARHTYKVLLEGDGTPKGVTT